MQDTTSIGAFNLSIGKRVVEAHGGQFVLGTKDKKSTVQFTLPVA